MNIDTYVFFRNADNDSYMNKASNFRGVNHATDDKLDIYFKSASGDDSYDKIILSIVDEKEKEVCDTLVSVFAGDKQSLSTSSSMVVIADDSSSEYIDINITAVDSITVESGSYATFSPATITTAIDRTMTAAESGSTVLVNHANKVITLPTVAQGAVNGTNFTIVPLIDPEAGWTVVAAEGIYGHITVISSNDDDDDMMAEQSVLRATAIGTPANYDNFDLKHDEATLGGLAGQSIKFTYDGGAWLVEAPAIYSDALDPASIAIINAG